MTVNTLSPHSYNRLRQEEERHMKHLIWVLLLTLTGSATAQSGITWHGTWQGGLRAARETGKPIFLTSAAPQCKGVSGLW